MALTGKPLRNPVADEYGGNVGQHHAKRCANDDRIEGLEPRGEPDRGDLGLVNDFGQEKSTERRQECARPAHPVVATLIFVRKQRPHGDAEEGNSEDPARPRATEQTAEDRAGETGGGMVCERG